MMTVSEVAKCCGVSIRTLQYYDKIGLLKATGYTPAGYRLYDEVARERLQQILLFRELEFSLADIRRILDSPNFDRHTALQQQKQLLMLKKERMEKLIALIDGIAEKGDTTMDFSAFDKTETEEYTRQVKARWGQTDTYREYTQKSQGRSKGDERALGEGLMHIFTQLGRIQHQSPDSEAARLLVEQLQDYITQHYYTCPNPILMSLGQIYAADEDFIQNIDAAGGEGTARFAAEAITAYVQSKE